MSDNKKLNPNFLKIKLKRANNHPVPTSAVKPKKTPSKFKPSKKKHIRSPVKSRSPNSEQQQPQSCIQIIQINTTAQYLETSISTSQLEEENPIRNVDSNSDKSVGILLKDQHQNEISSNGTTVDVNYSTDVKETPLDLTVKK
jgi:hypothetical protein